MGEPWVLAIDLGTGGPKTGAVSLRGELLAAGLHHVPTRFSADGGATQDPQLWWSGVRAGVGGILAAGVRPADLVGVGITGQWGSTVPVAADGSLAGDCLLWSDTRGGRFAARVMGGPVNIVGYSPANLLRWLRVTGGAPSPHGADPLGHTLYLRSEEPNVYARTATFLEPLDYLAMRLTGRRAATPASMILSWLTDNRPGAKPGYVPALVRHSSRELSKLPELIPTGSVVGGILPGVAAELGLPSDVPVVAGVPDLHTAVIGSGAVVPYQGHITISTSAWIACQVPFKRTDVLHQVASVPGLRPGSYVVANNHETAGASLQWLRDAVLGPHDYETLTDVAAQAPPGAGGVMFTPWLNGERSPVEDRTLRAAFLNLSITSGRAEMVRAVLEGVAFNARWLLDAVEKFLKRPLPTLRILGGGATSDLWCRVHADVLNRRIERVADPINANLRGAGLFAAVSLGKLDLPDVARLVAVTDTYDPDPGARAVYEPMYREFAHLYGTLHGFYASLNGRRG